MSILRCKRILGAAASRRHARLGIFCLAAVLWSAVPDICPFSAVPPVSAAVPVKFTYQGNIRQNGFLVNGQREMAFRVYGSSDGVVPLWTSALMDIAVSTGVFKADLEPVIADWEAGNLWLELEIEGNTLSPREELTSSPYAINSLMLSGKRYTTAAIQPAAPVLGELWFDSVANVVKFWNGTLWVDTSGGGIPGAHAALHAGGGTDPIISLGTHTVTGYITVSSGVSAGWFTGDGSGLYNLHASRITLGSLSGDRIGNVIVSTHIVDGSIQGADIADDTITRAKLNQSGCANGDILQLSGTQWICGSGAAAGLEVDPLSIHNQDTLQTGTTFYVSSGTVNDLSVNNSLKVMGTAQLKGGPGQEGLTVGPAGNVGVGVAAASARLEVKGVDTQDYSLAVGTGTVHQVVVSTSGAVGIGTETPQAKVEVTGGENSGEYIMIFNSGSRIAAWLRNK